MVIRLRIGSLDKGPPKIAPISFERHSACAQGSSENAISCLSIVDADRADTAFAKTVMQRGATGVSVLANTEKAPWHILFWVPAKQSVHLQSVVAPIGVSMPDSG